MPGAQEKNDKAYQKVKTHILKKTEQASEPDMVGMLELLSLEFKIIVINMPKAVMDKKTAVITDGQCKQRDGNSEKEPNRNARD